MASSIRRTSSSHVSAEPSGAGLSVVVVGRVVVELATEVVVTEATVVVRGVLVDVVEASTVDEVSALVESEHPANASKNVNATTATCFAVIFSGTEDTYDHDG